MCELIFYMQDDLQNENAELSKNIQGFWKYYPMAPFLSNLLEKKLHIVKMTRQAIAWRLAVRIQYIFTCETKIK